MGIRTTIARFFPGKATALAPRGNRLPLPYSSGSGLWQNGAGYGFYDLWWGGGRRSSNKIDYSREIGDPAGNSAIAACLYWMCTSWSNLEPIVERKTGEEWEPDPTHPAAALLKKPNAVYNGISLHWAIISDRWTRGNAYGYVNLDAAGMPAEIDWLPADFVQPIAGGDGRLAHYEYKPKDDPYRLDPARVCHHRFGIDPWFPLRGRRPLDSLSREIYNDNRATDTQAHLLNNRGVPPSIISPAQSEKTEALTAEQANFVKAQFQAKAKGEAEGDDIVFPVPYKYDRMAFSPSEMDMSGAHKTPEERICAVFQLPPGVVGLGAGLDRNTYSNYEEALAAAYRDNILPMASFFALEWTRVLMPLYGDDPALVRISYDHGAVTVLQEDDTKLRAEAVVAYEKGVLTLEESRAVLGYETDEKTRDLLAKPTPMEQAEMQQEQATARAQAMSGGQQGGARGDSRGNGAAASSAPAKSAEVEALKRDPAVSAAHDDRSDDDVSAEIEELLVSFEKMTGDEASLNE